MRIVIAGTGNIAYHFANAFSDRGHFMQGVVARNKKDALDLGSAVRALVVEPSEIEAEADVIFIAVSDDSIAEVSKWFSPEIPQIHTSGTIDINALSSNEKGVLYPVQTFTKNRPVDMRSVPLCIEASSDKMMKKLWSLARSVSDSVSVMSSEKRKWLHLSAVIANNFTNQFYRIASELTQKHDLPFDLLKPLIAETSSKIMTISPDIAQTGPAKRGNEKVMNEHIRMLEDQPELQDLYKKISELIRKQKSKR